MIVPRVLVVDDDRTVCATIQVCLQREGFEVTVCDGGEAGMRALETSAFDVMLVDIIMPHMRGYESVRIFHERAPAIPLVAMSGYGFANLETPSNDFLRRTLELGATCCLRKPFTPNALLAAVNQCLTKPKNDRRSREIKSP
jgi:CheY-like chemotaxis protein